MRCRANAADPVAAEERRRHMAERASGCRACPSRRLLFPPALHRGRNPHRLAIFCDRSAGDVDAGLAQLLHDGVVGQHVRRALSASISCLMRWRTASAECASPPSAAAIAEVKKYFSSKMPRLVAMYLLAVTRDTVNSCMPIASAMVLRLSGRRCWTPCSEKRVLLAHDLGRHLQDGLGALIERAHQPSRGLQTIGEIGSCPCRSSRSWRVRHDSSG